jgi:hypothetical protein
MYIMSTVMLQYRYMFEIKRLMKKMNVTYQQPLRPVIRRRASAAVHATPVLFPLLFVFVRGGKGGSEGERESGLPVEVGDGKVLVKLCYRI